jgi:hypothetical protein
MSILHDKSKEAHKSALPVAIASDRQDLERKVEEGTKKAVEEYGEVFKRLADYDRT